MRPVPLLLAVATLAACSADSITGAPATAELPQPRPNFSITYASASDPSLLKLLETEKVRIADAQQQSSYSYDNLKREWTRLNRSWLKGQHDLLNCEPLPYAATSKIVGSAGGTLDFVMGATPNDAWVSTWNGQDPNSALAPSLALAGK